MNLNDFNSDDRAYEQITLGRVLRDLFGLRFGQNLLSEDAESFLCGIALLLTALLFYVALLAPGNETHPIVVTQRAAPTPAIVQSADDRRLCVLSIESCQ